MQHVDNEMDELFRRAAAAYPLKTGTGSRDITAVITNSQQAPAPSRSSIFKRRLLLLLLLAAVYGYYVQQHKTGTATIQREQFSVKSQMNKTGVNTDAAGIHTTAEITCSKCTGAFFTGVPPVKKAGRLTAILTATAQHKKAALYISESTAISGLNTAQNATASYTITAALQPLPGPAASHTGITAMLKRFAEKALPVTGKKSGGLHRGFYAGINAGPQFSQVKGQGFSTTGFDAGIYGGYRFGNRLSAEAGFSYASRVVFSEGRYFNMNSVAAYMPSSMELLSVKSRTNIAALEARLKLDITRGMRSRWYISSGIASYLLTKETNDYTGMLGGVQQKLHHVYNNKRGYLLSSLTLGIGNEFKTGRRSSLRIEPYWQLPLKGTGAGLMPVTTAGLHIGFVLPGKK